MSGGNLAPEDKKAGMFGLQYLINDGIVFAAAFAGAFIWQISSDCYPQPQFVSKNSRF
jgi:hypothetical protein